ncbi:hypothetical protein [Chromohalobacter moromii]|uniref:Uncharacterized protein n=1 Tax=Chromohalobacter moromii TaxID=2860329 RepID=A0A9X3B4C0_9GAMM|nr:hypothetical protein [Chromohalobacter moromii]MCT8506175.1 hypothetical protein [Chromohalobacter moromii]
MNRNDSLPAVALGFFALPAAACALMLLAAVGPSEYEVQQRQEARYCDNVQQWRTEAARGIEPESRYGHPDYDGIASEICTPNYNGAQLASQ